MIQWTYEPNEGYKNLRQVYSGVITQFHYYLGHVATYIAGTYETTKSAEQIGPVYTPVPANLQRDALNFLNRNVFQKVLEVNALPLLQSPRHQVRA